MKIATSNDGLVLRELLDRSAITELLLRYVEGIRQDDSSAMASVFAADAVLNFPRGPVRGRPAIEAYFATGLGDDKARRRGLTRILSALSLITNLRIEVGDDEAVSEYNAIIPTLAERDGATVLGIGVCRNVDRLVRLPEGWRIAERRKCEILRTELPALAS